MKHGRAGYDFNIFVIRCRTFKKWEISSATILGMVRILKHDQQKGDTLNENDLSYIFTSTGQLHNLCQA